MNYHIFIAGAFFIVTVGSFIIFDWLLMILHSEHYDEWVKSGKPSGFFFVPKEQSWMGGQFARMAKLIAWYLITEGWMRKNPKALCLSRILRFLAIVYFGLFFLLLSNQAK